MTANVQIDITATDNASAEIRGVSNSLRGVSDIAEGIISSQVFLQMSQAAQDFAKSAMAGASDLNETISKTAVIFGENADEINKWAGDAADGLGMSKREALNAADAFAIFGKSAGKTGDDLVAFSQETSQLAVDLASFANTSVADASIAIQAAFRGENEAIRRYGVMIDDAALRTEAFKMGLISSTKDALTPQTKVLAAQALILKQTSDAQGDFARTSDNLAGSMKKFNAELANIKDDLGNEFIPAMTTLINGLDGLLKSFQALPAPVKWVIERLASLLIVAVALGPQIIAAAQIFKYLGLSIAAVGPHLITLLEGLGSIAPILSGAFAVAGTALGSFGLALLDILSGPIGWVIAAAALIAIAWETNFLGLRDFITQWASYVAETFAKLMYILAYYWSQFWSSLWSAGPTAGPTGSPTSATTTAGTLSTRLSNRAGNLSGGGAGGMTVNLYVDGKLSASERRQVITDARSDVVKHFAAALDMGGMA